VYEPSDPPVPAHVPSHVPAHVIANTALLRAGLERAARLAGLTPVDPGEPAVIALRCEGGARIDAPVEVRAGLDGVTVRIERDPDPQIWTALRMLAGELLGHAEDRPTEDRPTEDRPTEDRPTEDRPTEGRG
jgi:hypothetical protein